MDDHSCDRNPSPPQELADRTELIHADNIGDTVFSKHWLFTTLMKLIQEVDDQENLEKESEQGFDIDEALQDELCKLWDMSMSTDVVKFLQEFKAIEILTGVITKSQAPRVTEICIGILANMACTSSVGEEISKNEKLVKLVMLLTENHDAPTLVETMRLLYACVSTTPEARQPWITAIKSTPDLVSNIQFILSSSTNNDLLANVGEFLDKLLDIDDDICNKWATVEMLLALLETLKQIGFQPSVTLDTYLHIFQLVSTTETGVQSLVYHAEEVSVYLMQYLVIVCDDPVIGLKEREGSLSSTLSVLNVLIMDSPDTFSLLNKDTELIRCLLKILDAVLPEIEVRKSTPMKTLAPAEKDSSQDDKRSTDNGVTDKQQDGDTRDAKTDKDNTKCDTAVVEENLKSSTDEKISATPQGSGEPHDSGEPHATRIIVSPSPKPSTSKLTRTPLQPAAASSQQSSPAPERGTRDSNRASVLLYQIIRGFLEDITNMLHEPAPLADDASPRYSVPLILDYLDVHCPRVRIVAMFKAISDEDKIAKNILSKWREIATTYGLNRLADILERSAPA
ncbi:protein saal1-like [Tubulanus polymorphus]|uniref:protein saal1-like n=1 Tax=Tubulanus polymorphus TaxID=672921 RepID=UPI003DA34101